MLIIKELRIYGRSLQILFDTIFLSEYKYSGMDIPIAGEDQPPDQGGFYRKTYNGESGSSIGESVCLYYVALPKSIISSAPTKIWRGRPGADRRQQRLSAFLLHNLSDSLSPISRMLARGLGPGTEKRESLASEVRS